VKGGDVLGVLNLVGKKMEQAGAGEWMDELFD